MAELKAKLSIGQGEQGPRGLQGPQGRQGIQGPVGPKGERGEKGDIGPQGAQGLAGAVGPEGPAGRDGIDGKDGKSIKFRSLKPTYTYQQWLNYSGTTFYNPLDFNEGTAGLNVGDIFTLTGTPNDRPGMRMASTYEVTKVDPDGKIHVVGKSLTNLNGATGGSGGSFNPNEYYNKREADDRFLGKALSKGSSIKDFKDLEELKTLKDGMYPYNHNTKNKPAGFTQYTYGTVLYSFESRGNQSCSMTLFDKDTGSIYTMAYTGNHFTEWKQLATTDNVGKVHVKQNNAKGSYARWINWSTGESINYLVSEIGPTDDIYPGDTLITTATPTDRPEMKVYTIGLVKVKQSNGNLTVKGLGFFNKVDSYSRTEADAKFATTDDLHGAKIGTYADNQYSYKVWKNESKKENTYIYKQHLSMTGKDDLKVGDFLIVTTKPSDVDLTVTIYMEFIGYQSDLIRYKGLGMSTAVDAYSKTEADAKFATTDDLHGAKIGTYIDNRYSYNELKAWSKDSNQFFGMDYVKFNPALKVGDFFIMRTKPSDVDFDIFLHGKVKSLTDNRLYYEGLGISTSAYLPTRHKLKGTYNSGSHIPYPAGFNQSNTIIIAAQYKNRNGVIVTTQAALGGSNIQFTDSDVNGKEYKIIIEKDNMVAYNDLELSTTEIDPNESTFEELLDEHIPAHPIETIKEKYGWQ